jgi:ribosome-associated protein
MNKTVAIRGEFVKLSALLKFTNLCASGGEAGIRIANGEVLVNGEICRMRGKKIKPGDEVRMGDVTLLIRLEP